MSEVVHRVARQLIEIVAADRAVAERLADRAAAAAPMLAARVAACLDRADDGRRRRIDRLEVIVPRCSPERFEDEIAVALDAALAARLAGVDAVDPVADALDLLAAFAGSGRLPWWGAAPGALPAAAALLAATDDRAATEGLGFILGLSDAPHRLARALPAPLLARLSARATGRGAAPLAGSATSAAAAVGKGSHAAAAGDARSAAPRPDAEADPTPPPPTPTAPGASPGRPAAAGQGAAARDPIDRRDGAAPIGDDGADDAGGVDAGASPPRPDRVGDEAGAPADPAQVDDGAGPPIDAGRGSRLAPDPAARRRWRDPGRAALVDRHPPDRIPAADRAHGTAPPAATDPRAEPMPTGAIVRDPAGTPGGGADEPMQPAAPRRGSPGRAALSPAASGASPPAWSDGPTDPSEAAVPIAPVAEPAGRMALSALSLPDLSPFAAVAPSVSVDAGPVPRDRAHDPLPVPGATGREGSGRLAPVGADPAGMTGTVQTGPTAPALHPPGPARATPVRDADHDALYPDGCGVTLLWPLLPDWFAAMGLVGRDRRFVSPAAQHRAASLLDHLATADRDPPEARLPLAKLIAGLPLGVVHRPGPPIADDEADAATAMLGRALGLLPMLGRISVAGLRGAWLARSGRLAVEHGGWTVRVDRRAWDLLLDRLPWSPAEVALPWMPDPVRVEW